MLFVSLVCPHFPLIARPEWYNLYPEDKVPWPGLYAEAERPTHPYVQAMRACQIYDQGFDDPAKVRKAIAAYFGLVSFVDHNVGRLMKALEDNGLSGDTRVIYTSDHGDNLGTRGLWGKSNMYEELAGVPMIMAGPDVPAGVVCREPVSLVDCFPTIVDCAGLAPHPDDRDLPGAPLMDIVRGTAPERTVMSEYHAAGSATGAFMIRKGKFKYVHYVGMPPQLFDLEADPYETSDLGRDPGYRGLVADCEAALRKVVESRGGRRAGAQGPGRQDRKAGGREAILAKGSFGYSPVPGTKPVYNWGISSCAVFRHPPSSWGLPRDQADLQRRPAAAGRVLRVGSRGGNRQGRVARPAAHPERPSRLMRLPGGRFRMGTDASPLPQDGESPPRQSMCGRSPSIPSPSRTTGSASSRRHRLSHRGRAVRLVAGVCGIRAGGHQGHGIARRPVLVAARGGCLLEAPRRAAIQPRRPARSSRRARVLERRRRVRSLGRRPPADRGRMGVRGGGRACRRAFPGATRSPTMLPSALQHLAGRVSDAQHAGGWLSRHRPADAFAPNGHGLFNMAGNTWEWCADAFRVRSLARTATQRNGSARAADERLLKGGSYLCHRSYCYRYRIAARTGVSADSSTGHVGFRLVFDE